MSDVATWVVAKLDELARMTPRETLASLPGYVASHDTGGSVFFYGRTFSKDEVPELRATVEREVHKRLAGVDDELFAELEQEAQTKEPTGWRFEGAPARVWLRLARHRSLQVRSVAKANPPREDESLVELLVEQVKTAEGPALDEALEMLSLVGRGQNAAEKTIRRVLARPKLPSTTRAAAIQGLVTVEPGARTEFLAGDDDDRRAVLAALEGSPLVLELVWDPNAALAEHARRAVSMMAPEVLVPTVVETLTDGTTNAKLAALSVAAPLVETHRRKVLDPILALATKGKGPVKTEAATVLASLAKTPRLPKKQLEAIADVLGPLPEHADAAKLVKARLAGKETSVDDPLARMEAELEEGGSDDAWAVYGDALSSAGDVRGELVVTQLKGSSLKRLIKRHQAALFGSLVDVLEDLFPFFLEGLTWRRGFIEKAVLKVDEDVELPEALEALLTAPAARFLSKLELGPAFLEADENDYRATVEVLDNAPGAHLLRSLLLGAFDSEELEMSWAPWGDVSGVWKALPELTELHLRGSGGTVGSIRSGSLERLIIETGGLSLETFNAVVDAKLPKLKHLELWFGSGDYGAECEASDVKRLLARVDPNLRTLGLRNAEFTHELIPLLAKWKPLKKLEALDLSLGVLVDDDVDLLLSHREAFSHLATLDLRGNHLEARVKDVKKALPNAVVETQRESDGDRYVAVGE